MEATDAIGSAALKFVEGDDEELAKYAFFLERAEAFHVLVGYGAGGLDFHGGGFADEEVYLVTGPGTPIAQFEAAAAVR